MKNRNFLCRQVYYAINTNGISVQRESSLSLLKKYFQQEGITSKIDGNTLKYRSPNPLPFFHLNYLRGISQCDIEFNENNQSLTFNYTISGLGKVYFLGILVVGSCVIALIEDKPIIALLGFVPFVLYTPAAFSHSIVATIIAIQKMFQGENRQIILFQFFKLKWSAIWLSLMSFSAIISLSMIFDFYSFKSLNISSDVTSFLTTLLFVSSASILFTGFSILLLALKAAFS